MNDLIIKILKNGGVGILLTDTLYGLVGRALDKKAIKRIYRIKGRNNKKPLIILISSAKDLKLFGVKLNKQTKKTVENLWPGSVSVILPCLSKNSLICIGGPKRLLFACPEKSLCLIF